MLKYWTSAHNWAMDTDTDNNGSDDEKLQSIQQSQSLNIKVEENEYLQATNNESNDLNHVKDTAVTG